MKYLSVALLAGGVFWMAVYAVLYAAMAVRR